MVDYVGGVSRAQAGQEQADEEMEIKLLSKNHRNNVVVEFVNRF